MKKSNSTLIAGPWVGEFGWELFAWQAYIRSLSRSYQKTVIICRSNSAELYKDFADQFVLCDERTGIVDSYYMHGFDFNSRIKTIILKNNLHKENNISIILPRRIGSPPHTHYTESFKFGNINVVPEYILFNDNDRKYKKYDFIFHVRDRDLVRGQDNWQFDKWETLKNLLNTNNDKTFACVGTKNSSGLVSETDDLRDIPLRELFGTLNNAKYVMGPSSGPMHLSSLCGAKHIVWGSRPLSLDRYEENWNPHKTPVLFLDEHSWHPSAEYVYEKYMDWKHD